MKVCIAGSRGVTGAAGTRIVRNAVSIAMLKEKFSLSDITAVVSGTAKGVDTLGEERAAIHNIPVIRMPADWDQFGKMAGFLRNEDMARLSDLVIIVWDGVSKGTKHMIDICKRLERRHFVYVLTPEDRLALWKQAERERNPNYPWRGL